MEAEFDTQSNIGITVEVLQERFRQHNRWGQQDHDSGKWYKILGEEIGESCKADLEGNGAQYRAELVQVAAVAVAMIECYDRKGAQDETKVA